MHHHSEQLPPNNCSMGEQLPGADPGIFLIGVVQSLIHKTWLESHLRQIASSPILQNPQLLCS